MTGPNLTHVHRLTPAGTGLSVAKLHQGPGTTVRVIPAGGGDRPAATMGAPTRKDPPDLDHDRSPGDSRPDPFPGSRRGRAGLAAGDRARRLADPRRRRRTADGRRRAAGEPGARRPRLEPGDE